ncbi:unnamed protein product, partial [Mesorhabditis belari]|uniref:Ion channel n=1 Tax=Mesorhabditis belari TaxID=2138241 RepID=A0AAF3EG70_9BILA
MGVFGKGLAFLCRDFSCWTSTHGIPHIGMANSQWLRFFWIFVVVACFCGFLFQLETLLRKYFAYQVNTETALQFSERVFPTVTICHLNPWKQMGSKGTLVDISDLITAYGNSYDGYSASSNYEFSAGLTGDRQQRAVTYTTMMSETIINDPVGEGHAYTYDDLVISCTYNAQTCNASDFDTVFDPNYGNCQQFNFNNLPEPPKTSSRAGPLYGLRMVFKTNQQQYLPWTEASGMVVVIHGMTEHPFPDVTGYYAPPGTASSMGVRFVSTTRLPTPYGDCTTETEVASTYYNGTYATEACLRACLQENIVNKCGCYDPAYAFEALQVESCYKNPVDNTTAAFTNKAIECINAFTNPGTGPNDFNLITQCDCPQPCIVESYSVTVSTAAWPSNQYTPSECNEPENATTQPWAAENMECVAWYGQNTALIEIYYERMNYQVLTESPAYSFVNLISDIGGQVGLFLGMSIISVIEFLTLLLLIFCYCTTHKQRKTEIENIEREMAKQKENTRLMQEHRRKRKMAAIGMIDGTHDNPMYTHDANDPVVPPAVQEPK